MDANFEIKSREGLARIGIFKTYSGKVNTPTIMPVLDPVRPSQINIEEITELGAEIFITNSYLIYRNEKTRENTLKMEFIPKYNSRAR